jgi:carbamoyl-phosphate synthase large subunit
VRRCARAAQPTPERVFQVKRAMRAGMTLEEMRAHGIDPWFLAQLAELLEAEDWYAARRRVDAGRARA